MKIWERHLENFTIFFIISVKNLASSVDQTAFPNVDHHDIILDQRQQLDKPGELEYSPLGVRAAGHHEHVLQTPTSLEVNITIQDSFQKEKHTNVSCVFQEPGNLMQAPTITGINLAHATRPTR